MTKIDWAIVHDCDCEETGNPTCWVAEINHPKYGKYVWINTSNNGFDVEVDRGEMETLIICKTLTSAKRWVDSHL